MAEEKESQREREGAGEQLSEVGEQRSVVVAFLSTRRGRGAWAHGDRATGAMPWPLELQRRRSFYRKPPGISLFLLLLFPVAF